MNKNFLAFHFSENLLLITVLVTLRDSGPVVRKVDLANQIDKVRIFPLIVHLDAGSTLSLYLVRPGREDMRQVWIMLSPVSPEDQ